MLELKETSARPRFSVGTPVRVKPGIPDPDYPDVYMDGWAGSICEIQEGAPTTYLVQWSRDTLESIHPACRDHCEQEDVDCGKMWLLEEDLEAASGKAAVD